MIRPQKSKRDTAKRKVLVGFCINSTGKWNFALVVSRFETRTEFLVSDREWTISISSWDYLYTISSLSWVWKWNLCSEEYTIFDLQKYSEELKVCLTKYLFWTVEQETGTFSPIISRYQWSHSVLSRGRSKCSALNLLHTSPHKWKEQIAKIISFDHCQHFMWAYKSPSVQVISVLSNIFLFIKNTVFAISFRRKWNEESHNRMFIQWRLNTLKMHKYTQYGS